MASTGRLPVVCCALLLLGAGACGMKPQRHYVALRAHLLEHDYAGADDYLQSTKEKVYGKGNRLLYYMDRGMVLSLDKKYKESNAVLEVAKETAEELWTESVGAHAAAWLTTDNALPYQGEDFEKAFLHVIAALNYLNMGAYAEARVEARQVTNKLELYSATYEKEAGPQEEGKTISAYRDDAFVRWFAGKMAATEGGASALNDAWIDYRKAIELYEEDYARRYGTRLPNIVVGDALDVLSRLGKDFAPEYETLWQKYGSVAQRHQTREPEMAEVVLLHLCGEAPYKVDKFWQAVTDREVVRIAYPAFVPKPPRIVAARLRLPSGATATSEVVENITAIAVQNLADHMGRIKAKAVARAVAKFVAGKAAQVAGKKKGGNAGAALQVAGLLWNAASAVAEEADKRSWLTLPARVNVARAFAPPGDITAEVDFLDASGRVVTSAQVPAVLAAGETTFLTLRTYK